MSNPLIPHDDADSIASNSQAAWTPAFGVINPSHADAAIDQLLAECRSTIEQITSSAEPADWNGFVEPLEAAEDRLSRAWAPVSHLNMVCSSDDWRRAHDDNLAKLTEFYSETGQNPLLYRRWKALNDRADELGLDAVQRKIVRDSLRDFELSGVALPVDQQTEFRDIMTQLSALQTQFEQNVMDCTDAWSLDLDSDERLTGLNSATLDACRDRARLAEQDGWRLALDFPTFHAVMTQVHDRELRETLYRAWSTRASGTGPHKGGHDNSAVIDDILALRHRAANLLGYASYADRALVTRMARTPEIVIEFLESMAARARPAATREARVLRDFASDHGGPDQLEAWDLSYWSERLQEHTLGISSDMLRPWFALPAVIDGMFGIAARAYGIEVAEADDIPAWHDDVTVYRIHSGDELVGIFYLDPYSRKGKRGGAWMDEFAGRYRRHDGLQLPVATLVCNFAASVGDKPSLLSHEEVTTLFHEFGHGLHHLLTRVDYPAVSGIRNVAWDAVELPSQFNENWCWERESLDMFARHHETGEPLPDDMFENLQRSRRFHAGMSTLRQVEFALLDFRLHHAYDPARGSRLLEVTREVHDQVAVFDLPDFNRFAHSFGHIFAGGYAAGYYSYKWAEVLAADAFEEFRQRGIFDADCSRRFRDQILARGGSDDADVLFRAYRGRDPQPDALLRQDGLLDDAA